MLSDLEALAADTFALRCYFLVHGKLKYNFTPNVNINLSAVDIKDDILNEPELPDNIVKIQENRWQLFLVEKEIRLKLDGEMKLKDYAGFDKLSGHAHIEFISDGPIVDDEEGATGGAQPVNKMTFKCTVEPLNGRRIEFAMELNITLPVSNIIDCIVQHDDVPPRVKASLVDWTLFIFISDTERLVAGDEVLMNAIGGRDFYSDDIRLKVLAVDRQNIGQDNSPDQMINLGLRLH